MPTPLTPPSASTPQTLPATIPPAPPSKPSTPPEAKLTRALRALPLILILPIADLTFGRSLRQLDPLISTSGNITSLDLGSGIVVPFCTSYFGLRGLDEVIGMFTAFFTSCIGGYDRVGRLQAIAFLADLVPMQVIWMVEGSRSSSSGTITSRFRTLFLLLAQVVGIAYVAPIYFSIQYVERSPVTSSDEKRKEVMVSERELKTVLPTIGLAYILPSVAMFAVPGLVNRQWINGVFFQPFPLYAYAIQRTLLALPLSLKKEEEEEEATETDLRLIYGLSTAASASVYLCLWIKFPSLMAENFFSETSNPTAPITMLKGAAKVLRYDQLCSFGAGAVWTLLHFWDLKREGLMRSASWGKILGVFGVMNVVGGPGAAMAGMWAWRESILKKEIKREEGELRGSEKQE